MKVNSVKKSGSAELIRVSPMPFLDALFEQSSRYLSRNISTTWEDNLSFYISLALSLFDSGLYFIAISDKMRTPTEVARASTGL